MRYHAHCTICDEKFIPNYSNKEKILYAGKLEYLALFCDDCKVIFEEEDPEYEVIKELPSYPGDDTTH